MYNQYHITRLHLLKNENAPRLYELYSSLPGCGSGVGAFITNVKRFMLPQILEDIIRKKYKVKQAGLPYYLDLEFYSVNNCQ